MHVKKLYCRQGTTPIKWDYALRIQDKYLIIKFYFVLLFFFFFSVSSGLTISGTFITTFIFFLVASVTMMGYHRWWFYPLRIIVQNIYYYNLIIKFIPRNYFIKKKNQKTSINNKFCLLGHELQFCLYTTESILLIE